MRKAIGWVGVAFILCAIIAGFIAYFVFSFDPQTKVTFDGFGRQLSESPWFLRLILGQDRLWAGWIWFIADIIIFWSVIGIGISLSKWGFKEEN